MLSRDEILSTLDGLLAKNDYAAAEQLLIVNLAQAEAVREDALILLLCNELMGLSRKLGKEAQALHYVDRALSRIKKMQIDTNVGAATTYLNCATVFKAFGKSARALPLFEKAQDIYTRTLSPEDKRLAGLYNNMALALVDEKQFDRAEELYDKALSVLPANADGQAERAITYLNKASAVEARVGLEAGEREINALLSKAEEALDQQKESRDGGYAFACEKCASVFGYYGHFLYEEELLRRARRIYEGN